MATHTCRWDGGCSGPLASLAALPPQSDVQFLRFRAFTCETSGKTFPDMLEARLTAQRAESGLILDIRQVRITAVGPTPPHCPLEHRQGLIAPALNRPDRGNVGIKGEGNRSLVIDGSDPGG